jgi:CHAT domain-containing protein
MVSGRRLLAVVEPAPVDAPPLPFARWEARGFAAGAGLDAIELPGVQATPLRFRRHAPESDVLHLACHGWANLADPLSSGLLLATGRQVVLRQLMEMRLRVRLAVLSACETALPGIELPDEVIGLPTGLLQAGVAGVVASQWAVLDQATAMLMTEFARRWAGGEVPPAVALRQAQQWLRDTTNGQKRAHWLAALHEEPILPADVVEQFVEATSFVEPHRRDHEDLVAWAAFAHLGA